MLLFRNSGENCPPRPGETSFTRPIWPSKSWGQPALSLISRNWRWLKVVPSPEISVTFFSETTGIGNMS